MKKHWENFTNIVETWRVKDIFSKVSASMNVSVTNLLALFKGVRVNTLCRGNEMYLNFGDALHVKKYSLNIESKKYIEFYKVNKFMKFLKKVRS